MRAVQIIVRCFVRMIITSLKLPPGMPVQESGQPEQADRFNKEELVQLLGRESYIQIGGFPDADDVC